MAQGFDSTGFATPGSAKAKADALTASPRLFDNRLLDKLSRVHWSVPLAVYVPVICILGYVGFSVMTANLMLGAIATGYVVWTLSEYFGHRYLFHWEFPGRLGARLHFLIHGVHHVHPNDPLRLVMPILLSGPLMLAAFGVGRLIFPEPFLYGVLAGFLAGYLSYDMTHYYIHHAEPKTRLGMTVRRLHMLHHFRDATKGFGVSVPWLDYVFATAYRAERRG